MTRMLGIAAAAVLVLAAKAQNRKENVLQELHANERTIYGVLIDAGCVDRSVWNTSRPAEPASQTIAGADHGTRGGEASRSNGISVDSQTIRLEREDVTVVMNAELSVRQSDPTCAIRANTRAFAVVMHGGRLLNLDDGGNTYATAAVQASQPGREMINGRGPGFKPVVTIVGRIQGDRVIADEVKLKP